MFFRSIEQEGPKVNRRTFLRWTLLSAIGSTACSALNKLAAPADLPQKSHIVENPCSTVPLSIDFRTTGNPEVARSITEYVGRLPRRMINQLNVDRWRVIILQDYAAVQKYYPGTRDAGGFADFGKREIVVANAIDFPHELAHAVDFSFGYLAVSDRFIEAEAAVDKPRIQDMVGLYKQILDDLNKEKDDSIKAAFQEPLKKLASEMAVAQRFQVVVKLPKEERMKTIFSDGSLLDLTMHLFVAGFQGYYFQDIPMTRSNLNPSSPLYVVFQQYDQELRKAC